MSVGAYMIMWVIALSLYIAVVALSSPPSGDLLPESFSSPLFSYVLVFVMLPTISIIIMYALDRTLSLSLIGAKDVLHKGVIFSMAAMGAFVVVAVASIIQQVMYAAKALPIFLAAAFASSAYKSMQFEKNMKGIVSEIQSYLSDIAESRKAGL